MGKQPDYRLGFRSAVENVGDGPLIFDAHRPGLETGTMEADQLIEREGAPMEVVDGAKTSVWLATLPADGPTGGYFHMESRLPW